MENITHIWSSIWEENTMINKGNTILITGGSGGIGYALAKRFLKRKNTVIICGRNEEKLENAAAQLRGVVIRKCDVGKAEERLALVQWLADEYPDLNILVNNAGIQQRINLTAGAKDWEWYSRETAINLDAPIHLSMLLAPALAKRENPSIINITSGLAFTPIAAAPIYCATKAALHSFTVSLRSQLANQGITVVEVAPPAVDTDLGGPGQHTYGVPVDEFADAVMAGLGRGEVEIGYGTSNRAMRMSRDEIDAAVENMNQHIPVPEPESAFMEQAVAAHSA